MNIKGVKIFHKLAISYFLVGSLTVLIISVFFYSSFKKALIERTSHQLSSINILKKDQIEQYINFRNLNLQLISHDAILQGLIRGTEPETTLKIGHVHYLQELFQSHRYQRYILLNKDSATVLTSAGFDKELKDLLMTHEGRQFLKNSYQRYSLLDATRFQAHQSTSVYFGIPVISDSSVIGALILQRDFKEIESIVFERTGMGNTGESYLVASDYKMRSHSRFYPDKIPYALEVKTKATNTAFGGGRISVGEVIQDYRGVEVLSFVRPIENRDIHWAILSEIDYEEALTPVYKIRDYIILTGSGLVALILLVTVFLSRKISRPVINLKGIINSLSQGELPEQVEPESSDEIGEMTMAIDRLIDALRGTTHFAYEIGEGNFKIDSVPLSDKDVLGFSLIQMRDRLKELKLKEATLMRERSSALLEGQEKERRRLSRELHDGIGQLLTVIRFKIATLEGQEDFKKEIKVLLDDTITEVRRISNNVMPSVLLDFGLEAALKNLCTTTSKISGIEVIFNYFKNVDMPVNFETNVSLYRIAQEALNNMVKYSKATEAELVVIISSESIFMEIRDNGEGFDMDSPNGGEKISHGLRNMEERTNILQGHFEMHSDIGKGTSISVEIPLLDTVI